MGMAKHAIALLTIMMLVSAAAALGQTQTAQVGDGIAAVVGADVRIRLAEKCRFRPPLWVAQQLARNRQTALFLARRGGIQDAYVDGAERQAQETADMEFEANQAVTCASLARGTQLQMLDELLVTR